MAGKMLGMKVKLFIKDATTGKILAGQRNAILNRSVESIQGFKSWSIDADRAFVQDNEAYKILETAFLNSENVDVYLEMPSGTKYEGNATITELSMEFPYDDLTTWSLSLQGNSPLVVTESI